MDDIIYRPRRLRKNENIRKLVCETNITPSNLIYPLFVVEGKNIKNPIPSMPGCFQLSIDNLIKECGEIKNLGIPGIILFGIPDHKDDIASGAYSNEGIIPRAVSEIKNHISGLLVATDLCFCEYTSHGHCGIIQNNDVDNDKTLELIYKTALSQAKAGADIIAPSDMMDGRVKVIRKALDENNHQDILIMSYSAKYASAYYGPFRDAAGSTPSFGDRKTYQMDPANGQEAIREISLDIDEGADIVMVKPALAYLDIIRMAKDRFNVPIAAYNVSGEYSMIKAASQMGWVDEKRIVIETLTSIKRAGANIIITYFAKDFVKYSS